jgi:hypothetical protein
MADEQSGQHQVPWVNSGIKYMINSSCLWENKYEQLLFRTYGNVTLRTTFSIST